MIIIGIIFLITGSIFLNNGIISYKVASSIGSNEGLGYIIIGIVGIFIGLILVSIEQYLINNRINKLKKKETKAKDSNIKQTEYRGEKNVINNDNWICGKCGTINDIYLPNCKRCGNENI